MGAAEARRGWISRGRGCLAKWFSVGWRQLPPDVRAPFLVTIGLRCDSREEKKSQRKGRREKRNT
jgi:hypothetical protein